MKSAKSPPKVARPATAVASPAWTPTSRLANLEIEDIQMPCIDAGQRDIASKGGQASSGSFEPGSERAREAGRKGGSRTGTGGDDAE